MKCKCAVIQCVSTDDLNYNLVQVERLLVRAAEEGCELVILPENFAYFSAKGLVEKAELEQSGAGPVMSFLSRMAKQHGFWLVGGSIPLSTDMEGGRPPADKVYSACLVYDDKGQLRAQYNKVHLFDASVGDRVGSYRESDQYAPGAEIKVVQTPWGRLGLAICYDIRFPEFFRLMLKEGIDMLAVPAAFTYATGQPHWEVLLRARAIENQVFLLASNQGGLHHNERETWGHSMIIDYWGEALAEKTDPGPGVVVADLDFDKLGQIRQNMPVLKHRKF